MYTFRIETPILHRFVFQLIFIINYFNMIYQTGTGKWNNLFVFITRNFLLLDYNTLQRIFVSKVHSLHILFSLAKLF